MYIKVEDLFNATIRKNAIWNHITDEKGNNLFKIVNGLEKFNFEPVKKTQKKDKK